MILDEKSSLLLEKISASFKGNGSQIFEESELSSCFKEGRVEKEELLRMLRHLELKRFLEIQYAEEGLYCLNLLPDGRAYFETVSEGRREKKERRRELILFSALGGFLGGLLSGAIFLLVLLGRGA